eukprot:UN29849
MSGLVCPRMPKPKVVRDREWKKKRGGDAPPVHPPPFAEDTKLFTLERLLHREVQVVLTAIDLQDNLYGSIVFPKGDIGELLLRKGFAKYVPWHCERHKAQRYSQFQDMARQQGVGIWSLDENKEEDEFKKSVSMCKLTQVVSGDCLF